MAPPSRRLALAVLSLGLAAASHGAPRAVPLDDFGLPGAWQVYEWNSAPGSLGVVRDGPPEAPNAAAIEVSIQWPQDDEFRFFSLTQAMGRGAIPFRLTEVGLWVRGGGDGHHMELHFTDGSGADGKVGLGSLTFVGWQRLQAAIPPEIPQPITLKGLTWHSWGMTGAGGPATVALAQVEGVIEDSDRLVEGELPPQLLVSTARPHGLADAAGVCELSLRVLRWETAPQSYDLVVSWADGDTETEERHTLTVAEESSLALPVRLPRYGAFPCAVSLEGEGEGEAQVFRTGLAWTPPLPPLSHAERLRSSIGVNTHYGAPWAAFEALGIHWARDYSWGWLGRGETAPTGNGRDYAAVLREAEAHGLIVLPITMGSFRREDESGFLDDAEAIAAGFERLSRAFPSIPYWEIENEFEYHLRDSGGLDPVNYRRALLAAAEGLARAGDARVIPNGTAGIRQDLAEELLASEAAAVAPALNSHYYVGTAPPEMGVSDTNVGGADRQTPLTALDQLWRIGRLAHQAGKESWLTETGWDVSNGPAVGEWNQAIYLPRNTLMARLMGTDKVFWFYDRDIPGGTGIFSTCGLIRVDGSIRPSGVAMAALSQQTARAEVVGSIDLGDDDLHCVALRQPEGNWTLAVWSIRDEHPLPAGLSDGPAVDLFGNPVEPAAITPAVTYFSLPELPEAWRGQLGIRLASTTRVMASPGSAATVAVEGEATDLTWTALPEGVTAGPWRPTPEGAACDLALAPTMAEGLRDMRLAARGDGWERDWPLSLVVGPALIVRGAPYAPGQPELWILTSDGDPVEATVELLGGPGIVAPSSFAMRPGVPQRVAVVPGASAQGTLTLRVTLSNGVTQEVPVRPSVFDVVALAAPTPDGSLAEWGADCLLPEDMLSGTNADRRAQVWLAATEVGLAVAARIGVVEPVPGRPDAFWDCSSLEIFADPEGSGGGWTAACAQVWMVPVEADGGWTLRAGRWDRIGGAGAIYDDRIQGAAAREGDALVIEALVPWAVLGGAPDGSPWRLGLSLQGVGAQERSVWAWPRHKGDGLTDGPSAWGEVTLGR